LPGLFRRVFLSVTLGSGLRFGATPGVEKIQCQINWRKVWFCDPVELEWYPLLGEEIFCLELF